jgi:hypothetical protein
LWHNRAPFDISYGRRAISIESPAAIDFSTAAQIRRQARIGEIALDGDFAYYSKAIPRHASNSLFIIICAVALSNTVSPAAAWYYAFYLYIVFALCERKNNIH